VNERNKWSIGKIRKYGEEEEEERNKRKLI
jgi:hypothetical protein